MLTKIKNSLLVQTGFTFFVSIVFIIILWVSFYVQQIQQDKEHNIVRYFNVVSFLQPLLSTSSKISDNNIAFFNMKIYDKKLPKNPIIILEKNMKEKCFQVISLDNKTIINIYNPISSIILEDLQQSNNTILIHIVFTMLLFIQIFLYLRLQKSLTPLSKLQNKLKELRDGDLSPLAFDSQYDEIKQIITSYNSSISQIEYLLETREMFNKIFMHEMKMPIAKGMFYLKQEPSPFTHKKLNELLNRLNNELDEFSIIESLIAYQNEIEQTPNNTLELISEAIQKVETISIDNITIELCETHQIKGCRELWIICFKNLIDNALKYSHDNKLHIKCFDSGISFINLGDELPLDLSNNIKKWKIDKTKRHKSSTGYGFGLFIIKNIVSLNKYNLTYTYRNKYIKLTILESSKHLSNLPKLK